MKRTRLSRKGKSGRKQRLTKISTAQIGDGKTPNKYWVSVSSDYYLYDPKENFSDWASSVKGIKTEGKTVKVFNTYEEAKRFTDSIELGSKLSGVEVNTVSIEDRLSGQVHERSLGANVIEDLKFTKEKEKELGVPSTMRQSEKSAKEVNAGNLLDFVLDYENGTISKGDYTRMFAYLIKTGQAWQMQSSLYGRPAHDLIESGVITKEGKINWEKVDEE